jgi:hypothetical protein
MNEVRIGIGVWCLFLHAIYLVHTSTSTNWQSRIMNAGMAWAWLVAAAAWWPR